MKEMLKGHAGDVQFRQIESIPDKFIETENKPIAIGNSGHCHVFTGNVKRYEKEERIVYNVIEPARLQHTDISLMNDKTYSSPDLLPVKDHNPHLLPVGVYEFFIQQAYNPYSRMMEDVQD